MIDGVQFAGDEALRHIFGFVDVLDPGVCVVDWKHFLGLQHPLDIGKVDAVTFAQQASRPDGQRGAISARADAFAGKIFGCVRMAASAWQKIS